MSKRTTMADVLHEAGQLAKAKALIQESGYRQGEPEIQYLEQLLGEEPLLSAQSANPGMETSI